MLSFFYNRFKYIFNNSNQINMKQFFTPFSTIKKLALLAAVFYLPSKSDAQVLLAQDFNASTVVADYVGTGQNQFDFIGVANTGGSSVYFNATSGKLQFQRSGPALAMVKSTNFSSPSPTVLRISFKINVVFGTAFTTGANALFYVGSGLVAGATVTGEVATGTGNRHSVFGITIGPNVPNTCGGTAINAKEFYIRSTSTTPIVNSSGFVCEQEVHWFINNSGSTITYANTAGSQSTLINDAADIWVGNTRVFEAIPAVNPAQTLDNLKFFFNNGDGAISLDDIIITTGSNALPVAISSLKAAAVGAANEINWTTAGEYNNKGFYIERQTRNGEWNSIGFVAGSNRASAYLFKDLNPLPVSNYRLRQVDLDGKETYSNVVGVSKKTRERISITPNPATDKVVINLNKYSVANTTTTAVLYDLTGKKVLLQNSRTGTFELNLSNLSKGTYVLSIQSDNEIINEKIVKQ